MTFRRRGAQRHPDAEFVPALTDPMRDDPVKPNSCKEDPKAAERANNPGRDRVLPKRESHQLVACRDRNR
jgi:hypothetical protein